MDLAHDIDTGAVLRPEHVPAYLAHPANHGRVVRLSPPPVVVSGVEVVPPSNRARRSNAGCGVTARRMSHQEQHDMTPTLDLDDLTLASGSHRPGDGAMCVMEAAAYMAGEPWSDHPECVSPVIAAFLRSWNDALPDTDRAQLVRYLANVHDGGVLGTGPASPELENRRSWLAVDWSVRAHTPAWLRLAGLDTQADTLENLPEILNPTTAAAIRPALDAVRKDAHAAGVAAGVAAWAAAVDAAGDAVGDAAWAAARDAAWAAAGDAVGDAARDAAWAAAGVAAGDAAGDAAWVAAGDAAWAAAVDAAWAAAAAGAAARAAAGDALTPTVALLQESAHELVVRMATATFEEAA